MVEDAPHTWTEVRPGRSKGVKGPQSVPINIAIMSIAVALQMGIFTNTRRNTDRHTDRQKSNERRQIAGADEGGAGGGVQLEGKQGGVW